MIIMGKKNISSYSYNAYIDGPSLDEVKILIFNHGTQNKKGGRTKAHAKDCANCEYELHYNIINEPNDRVIGGKLISGKADATFSLKVGKGVDPDAKPLSTADRIIRNVCLEAHLSETECVVIHYSNKEECIAKLKEQINEVNNWYYTDESIRVDIATYDPEPYDTDMSVRPFSLNRKARRFLDLHINPYKNYNIALVQGLAVANYIYSKFTHIKKFIVFVSDYDIYHNIDIYNEFKELSKLGIVIFKFYESDNEIKDLYMAELKNINEIGLIISNPPYGAIGAEIVALYNKYRNNDSLFINLMPANDYKNHSSSGTIWKFVNRIKNIPYDSFKDANVTTHIALLEKNIINTNLDSFERKTFIDPSLDKYFKFNMSSKHYAIDSASSWLIYNNYNNKTDVILPHQFKYNLVYYALADGNVRDKHLPLKKSSVEYKCNFGQLSAEDLIKANLSPSTPGKINKYCIKFKSELEHNNFIKFLYSKNGFRFISKILMALNADSTVELSKWIPKVDWSKEWTVEEILANYDYSEKEIKEVINDLNNFKYIEE